MYGNEFGPHYAVLFDDEVDDHFVRFLRQSYSIEVFLCKRRDPTVAWTDDARAAQAASLLRDIGGRAALHRHGSIPSPNLNDPLFNRMAACDELMQTAIELTGSFRGEICLTIDENLRYLQRVAIWPRSQRRETQASNDSLPEITLDSVIGTLFIKAKTQNDFVYMPDVRSAAASDVLKLQGFDGVTYVQVHPDVKSELACPILSDGKRVRSD